MTYARPSDGLLVHALGDDGEGEMFIAEYFTQLGKYLSKVEQNPLIAAASVLDLAARDWKRWEEMNK